MRSILARYQPLLASRATLFTSTHLTSAVSASAGKKPVVSVSPEETIAVLEREQKERVSEAVSVLKKFEKFVQEKTKRWNDMHEVYYGKERDLQNHPVPKIPEYHPKVRMGFIADSFFQAFYNKTGVTGPYLFLWGGLMYGLSKEIIIVDHELDELFLFICYMYAMTKMAGPKLAAFLDKGVEKTHEDLFRAPVRKLKTQAETMVKDSEDQIRREGALTPLYQAKRENVDMQLELAYRTRIEDLHKAVKARLDYQVEKENTRRNFQQLHMVNWVVDNVVKGISPQQEKDVLSQCFKDLQNIAKRQATATA